MCRLRVAVLAMLIASCPYAARAQSLVDSSTVASGINRSVATSASFGSGPGQADAARGNTHASTVRATVSAGSLLLTYRHIDVRASSTIPSAGVRGNAVLFGARTGGRRLFGSAALGYDRGYSYSHCRCSDDPYTGALAYDLTVHANAIVPGIAASFSGNIAPSRAAYATATIEFELGWFGK